jgi:hypothetical protein
VLGANALSAELEQVVLRALEKDRVDRYGTAAEMAAALRLTPEGRAISAPSPVRAQPSPTPVRPARRSRGLLAAGVAVLVLLGAAAAGQLLPRTSASRLQAMLSGAPVRPAPVAMAAAPAPKAKVEPAPPPTPVVETWIAHRDLAATYTGRGQHDDAFREVEAAIGENRAAAAADPALIAAAVNALAPSRLAFVIDAFGTDPRLIDALAEATARGERAELRHAAHETLRMLGQESRADLIAMAMLDVEQASECSEMRAAFKGLGTKRDPRVTAFKADLRKRGRSDPHVRCLRRALRR